MLLNYLTVVFFFFLFLFLDFWLDGGLLSWPLNFLIFFLLMSVFLVFRSVFGEERVRLVADPWHPP